MIGSVLAGLLLSTSLAACGGNAAQLAAPEPAVRVEVVRETPPADLLRCPAPVRGLPETGGAIIPADWRAGIIRMSTALGMTTNQLTRLLAWHGVNCASGPSDSPENP